MKTSEKSRNIWDRVLGLCVNEIMHHPHDADRNAKEIFDAWNGAVEADFQRLGRKDDRVVHWRALTRQTRIRRYERSWRSFHVFVENIRVRAMSASLGFKNETDVLLEEPLFKIEKLNEGPPLRYRH